MTVGECGETYAKTFVSLSPPSEEEDTAFAVGQIFGVADFLPKDRELGRDRDSDCGGRHYRRTPTVVALDVSYPAGSPGTSSSELPST